MNRIITGASLLSLLFVCSCRNSAVSTAWDIDNLKTIGGHKTTVMGSPKVIETDKGKAVEFDGVKDGLLAEALPLTGAEKFTLEIIFRPDAKGLKEQRFLHLQENGTAYRILIETRLTDNDLWYLDTYIETPEGKKALLDAKNTHPVGQWYCATLVYDGKEMRHYINGVKEMSAELAFRPLNKGKTSIGVRMNQVYWFKGAIRKIRFSREALEPKEFLQP